MNIIKNRNTFFGVSLVLVLISIIFIAIGGLKFGIDFNGGSLQEVSFKATPQKEQLERVFQELEIEQLEVQETDGESVFLRFQHVTESQHQSIKTKLAQEFDNPEELRFETIGPTIGTELRKTSTRALILVALAIIIYVAYVFRKVSYPVKSWKYGIAAIIALIHDIVIVTGLFAILGLLIGVEVDLLFVTALLTILGFSVNDTIVVFDRIRENLLKKGKTIPFTEVVTISTRETVTRSLNTSITTLFVLLALLLFGGQSIQWFVIALMAGVVIGTYSSIFVASALLVEIETRQKNT